MNRLYLIVPVVLLALFGGIYWQHTQVDARRSAEKAAVAAEAEKVEAAKKAEAERLARIDAEKRAAERRVEEEKKATEKLARYEEESRRIATDTARYNAKVAELMNDSVELEKQLADLRARRTALNTENFALAKDVELARIAKRNAELEIQRLTEMVARQAGNTTLAK
ncbi:hypothetical protein [Rariglobus hedericola]|uniref:Uncharacterized protein n=1 Tax=Rariglobus hedericola TaxID=2597822 RepID=A0A556QNX7_9BACT|nr:hypothetical protein [Rariglobus hedericola]TSJ78341.1 hypothetical protein FPL22_03280 [Rariglobus hedericola]